MDFPSIAEQAERRYISTGRLPEPVMVQRLLADAHTIDCHSVLRTLVGGVVTLGLADGPDTFPSSAVASSATASLASPPSLASLGVLVGAWSPQVRLAVGVTQFDAAEADARRMT